MTDPDIIGIELGMHLHQWFADLVVVLVELTAQQHPAEFRHALQQAMNLRELEDRAGVAMMLADRADERARLAEEKTAALMAKIEAMEGQLDAMRYEFVEHGVVGMAEDGVEGEECPFGEGI
jgi:hypothetical protein